MDEASLVREAAAHSADAILADLVKLSEPNLFAALGQQVSDTTRGDQSVIRFDVQIDVDELDRGTFSELGMRIFHRWNRALHEFLCTSSSENAELRSKVLNSLSGKDVGSGALVVGVLVGVFGLSPAVATIIAALLLKIVVQPATEEICKFWGEQLKNA